MPIGGIEHINIWAVDLDATLAFYREVLGMEPGDRPPFDFPGAWLYAGGAPVIHLVGPRAADANRPPRRAQPTGQIDHVALAATGLAEMRARLQAKGVTFREQVVPRDGVTQIFLTDPNGVVLELNFPAAETGS
ncbi:glyoxalase [Roseomonas stagni]|uniref:Glyoxalase n=1 Tax=Falsiroseomonas algicola TaxID=2716930 RepID=A0A6M1LLJ2_9PROT|nr:VOC family protein [Falsiroseomonas algicola]NGM21215.1 glyoxalase [Falsiroseomonas algicola]